MSTAAIEISSRQDNKLTATKEQLDLARNTIAKDLDANEFGLFLYNCQRLGVHPLDGMVVPIKRNDTERGEKRLTFVITVDLLRSRAADSGEYAGSDDATYVYEMKDANLPSDATVTVWRFVQGQKCAFTATARWSEYYPGDQQGFMWKQKPHLMLSKCAEALALRKGFPKQLAGFYIAEELQREIEPVAQQQTRTTKKPTPRDTTGDVKCNECGAINGHLPHCKYRQKAQQGTQPEQQEKKSEALTWLVSVEAIDERKSTQADPKDPEKTITKKYLMLSCINIANEPITLYCWHTGETWKRIVAVAPKTKCIFNVKPQPSGGKTYYAVDSIVEITGEKKPDPSQGELIPPDQEKF